MLLQSQVAVLCCQLLETWSSLKEVFRIPKKERIEKMKEHEREADQEYHTESMDDDQQNNRYCSYDRRPPINKDKMKRSRESPDRDPRKTPRLEIDKYIFLEKSFPNLINS